MLFTNLFLLTSSLVSASGIEKRTIVSSPSAFKKQATSLGPASNTLTLNRQKPRKGYNTRSAAYLLHGKPSGGIPASNHTTGLLSLEIGEEFATNITFGEQTFVSIVDTGSSDTWVVEQGFQCVNITTGAPLSEADCFFGPTFTSDSTFTQIPNENFNITYGDGEFLTGIVGYEDVTLAGIKVRQEVALVNYAAWEGDSVTSGLTGFAYPAL
jgi:aspergillopepsin I